MVTKTHGQQLHILFLPFMGQGHTLPLIDIAKLFALRGERSTIIATEANAPIFIKAIQTSQSSGLEIDLVLIKFPSAEVGLPEGIESTSCWSETPEIAGKFFKALTLLQQQVEQLIEQHHPNCLVASSLFTWTTDVAAKFGIPRLIFQGPGFFSLCAAMTVTLYKPHMKVSSDSDSFVLPNLPHEIKMTKQELPSFITQSGDTELTNLLEACRVNEERSYGILMNSFYELEPDYVDHYRKVFGRRSWHIGPVSLCNKAEKEKLERGREGLVDGHECLHWLNSKKPGSVVYICFGSLNSFSNCELLEIALGLEASQHDFIWVVKKEKNDKGDWLPEGYEQRMEGKGLIIKGWAPQLLILQHEAVGAFLTHCGWNSILEGVTAAVPMITWPLFHDQFYNEKLVTQILGIGVAVGAQKSEDGSAKSEASVKRDAIRKAVTEVMEGDKAEGMRSKAFALGKMARSAIEVGGSSFSDLTSLIQELRSFQS